MTCEALNTLANIAMALAASAGAFAAFRGLNTWRTQSVWHADSDLSRKLLVALYRYRASLYAVRHPAMSFAEMAIEEDGASRLSPDEAKRQGVIEAYFRRWERHYERRNELDALLIEAEAVWGSDLQDLFKGLRDLENELFAYINLYLDAHFRGDTELASEYRKILKSERDILYDSFDDEKDAFRNDFKRALEPVERYLKSKLGRA